MNNINMQVQLRSDRKFLVAEIARKFPNTPVNCINMESEPIIVIETWK